MVEKKQPAEIVNLRQARKDRARDDARRAADANRTKHGLSKAATSLTEARNAKARRDLEGHKREDDEL